MVNALTLKVEELVCCGSFKDNIDDNKDKISSAIENGNQIINTDDGLTLQEVYDAFVTMLSGDLNLVREVLSCSRVMVACGVHIAQESQLSKHDVYKMINDLKNQSTSIDGIKSPPNIQKDSTKLKGNRKQSRGRG